jgi:hypothetical protein
MPLLALPGRASQKFGQFPPFARNTLFCSRSCHGGTSSSLHSPSPLPLRLHNPLTLVWSSGETVAAAVWCVGGRAALPPISVLGPGACIGSLTRVRCEVQQGNHQQHSHPRYLQHNTAAITPPSQRSRLVTLLPALAVVWATKRCTPTSPIPRRSLPTPGQQSSARSLTTHTDCITQP